MSRLVVYVSPRCSNCMDDHRPSGRWPTPKWTSSRTRRQPAASTWTGFESVPTLVIAAEDSLEPCEAPLALRTGASPRGIDRGCLLTEPNRSELRAWLGKHGLLENPTGGPKANPADPRARVA